MDGTGELFADFVRALGAIRSEVVSYPADSCLTYSEVLEFLPPLAVASQPFVLLAESFSSPAAIAFAATRPPNLKGLVICGGFVTGPVPRVFRSFCIFLSRFLPSGLKLPLAIRLFLVGCRAPSRLVLQVKKVLDAVPAKTLSARLQAILACDARSELAKVNVPILLIRPTHDRLVGSSKTKEMRQIRPTAAVRSIDGPHLLPQRKPEQVAAVVAEFLLQCN
jgi:pimeloyl-ACP methyl ester carboxylesterase